MLFNWQISTKVCLFGFVLFGLVGGCSTTGSYYRVDQVFKSNEPCKLYINGIFVGAGRKIVAPLTPRDHTATCKNVNYADKVEYISPPYGTHPISIVFQVQDKVDAPDTWAQKRLRDDNAPDGDGANSIGLLPGEVIGSSGLAAGNSIQRYVDVLIEGYDDGIRTNRTDDRNEALLDAKRQAIERAGVRVSTKLLIDDESNSVVVDGERPVESDEYVSQRSNRYIENNAKGVLLPGYIVLDKGYQSDGNYLIILSGKVRSE